MSYINAHRNVSIPGPQITSVQHSCRIAKQPTSIIPDTSSKISVPVLHEEPVSSTDPSATATKHLRYCLWG
uniref:Uncharacterized protein n=1 Tax=Romanomermis culicivorax TaxID=13658 RepID=A0A915IG76_ROMCU